MYVKLYGGRQSPGGYIVPCDVLKTINDSKGAPMWDEIRLTGDGANSCIGWVITVRHEDLLTDEEAEAA